MRQAAASMSFQPHQKSMVQDTITDLIFDRPNLFSFLRTESCLTSMKNSSRSLWDDGTLLIALGPEFKLTQTKS